jgi:undecaprenyl-diphosphatase
MTPLVVAASLIVGGIAIIVIERIHGAPRIHRAEEIPPGKAFVIGLAQCIAMIPGVSRSGATIMGGLLLKVDRQTATDFSFFLAIPTMFGATLYDLYKNRHTIDASGAETIAVGFVVSFIVALIAVRWMLRYIKGHGFTAFAIYRIIVGAITLALLLSKGA